MVCIGRSGEWILCILYESENSLGYSQPKKSRCGELVSDESFIVKFGSAEQRVMVFLCSA
jgi:hypothetical protein